MLVVQLGLVGLQAPSANPGVGQRQHLDDPPETVHDGHARRIALIGQIGDGRHGGQRFTRAANDRRWWALRFDPLEHPLQCVADIAGVGVTIRRVLGQQAQDQRLEVAAEVAAHLFGAARRGIQMLDRGLADVFNLER